ncbi:hypothetical protein HPP92_023463 [Vanilla planifolia]|uniref:BHLH domain-containing protein n=1 Tax=Vanilla planifolia TaxID=51239 RepID=A0A835UGA0_VANPL|nr:hypothetical protein HPP92_023463 [Vanilla planifolia]
MDPNFFSFSTQEALFSYSDLHLWDIPLEPFFDTLAAISDPFPPSPPFRRRSAFSKYSGTRTAAVREPENSRRNIHYRLIELLRRIEGNKQAAKCRRVGSGEQSRGFRHMMRERHRRERLSQSYADLHSMLSPRAKADKNSIVQEAAALVRELKRMKQGMQNRCQELRNRASALGTSNGWGAGGVDAVKKEEIEFNARNPDSSIDCLISALRCLDQMEIKATSLRMQDFSGCGGGGGFTTVMTIETLKEGEATEVKEMLRRLAT